MPGSPFTLRDLWPLYELRVTTGDLELRYPTEAELPAFADLIEGGLHPAGEMPFGMAFTDAPTPERNVNSYQWWVGSRGRFSVDDWVLTLGVWEAGTAVGFQDVRGERFPLFRTVHTGSWLGLPYQGRGIGKLMRQAVLALAFDHLGARFAETSAFLDNVTTVLLIAPVTLSVTRQLEVPAYPFLFAEIFASNIGSEHLLEGVTPDGEIKSEARAMVMSSLRSHFRP